ncbi:MAG: prephenate dehydratase [Nitrospirota bacterium]|nr:prephenate dehydratase [Nitrospirota bacterium]
MSEIEELRQKIDAIDSGILKLLNERAQHVTEIGRIKKSKNAEIHVPKRELEIYQRLEKSNPGPFPNEAVRAVFREIISACLSLEQPLKVAFLGPKATFSHLACMRHFGFSTHYVPVNSIRDVFLEVEKGNCIYGVVPIENSTEGVITHTLDLLADSELKISAEVMLEVSHNLLSKAEGLDKVQKIYSFNPPAAQCRQWLATNLPNVPVQEVFSSARAAEMAAQDPASAAIASELAADLYGLNILSKRIEDNPNNITRFLVVGKKMMTPTGRDKSSIMFSIKDKVGALHNVLEAFARHGINLTKIESRPSRRKSWDYVFFADLEGHVEEERVKKALEALEGLSSFVKILGAYPVGS